MASAVLALVYPQDYAVIDFRVWRQFLAEQRTVVPIGDYKRYLHVQRRLADELGWSMQETDHALWAYDQKVMRGDSMTAV